MGTILVQEWMRTDVITINPELRVERAWELMARQRIRHLPVVKNGLLVGIITERDLKRTIFSSLPTPPTRQGVKPQPSGTPGDLPVEAIMTKEVYTVKPTDSLLIAVLRMVDEKIGALPVVDEAGKLLGILTETDLLKVLVFLLRKTSFP
jgi:acetoin utilization protein AcuB